MSKEETKDDALTPWRAQPLIKRSGALVRRGLAEAEGLKKPDKMQPSSQRSGLQESDPWAVLRAVVESLKRGDVKNSFGMELVRIPEGKFMMGSDTNNDEKPIHEVAIREPFYMGQYPVSQWHWQQIMGNNPSSFIGDGYPVDRVSWDDAQEFIRNLNLLDFQRQTRFNDEWTGDEAQLRTLLKYRLPTEAEWEYACRAGTTGDFAGPLDSMAWYANNSGRRYLDAMQILKTDSKNYVKLLNDNGNQMHPVGTKEGNAFGLYDMHGNVWDWCQDWYHETYYGAPTDGSAWLSGGEQEYRVVRGGSWLYFASRSRSAIRNKNLPENRSSNIGFRLVANVRT